MNHFKISFHLTALLIAVLLIPFSCKNNSSYQTDYRKTHAWERFERSLELYRKHEMKAALFIVDSLIADDNYKAEGLGDEQGRRFLTHIYRHRTRIMAFNNNQPQVGEWACKTAELCRTFHGSDDGISCVESEMDIFLGMSLINTGKQQEGVELMKHAISSLDAIDSWEGRQAQISCIHKIAALNKAPEDAHQLDSLSKLALGKLSDMKGKGVKIKGQPNKDELDDFVDFFTGKFLSWQAHAYMNMAETSANKEREEAYRDSARICVSKALATHWGKTSDADVLLLDLYPSLGMYDEFDKAAKVVAKEFEGDTLNRIYITLQRSKSIVAEKRGDLKSALMYQKRASMIASQEYQNNMKSQMAQTIEAHQLENERQAHLETRIHLQQLLILSLFLLVLFVGLIVYYFYRQKQHREHYERFRAIIEKYETGSQTESSSETAKDAATDSCTQIDKSADDTEAQSLLYAKIMTVMNEQKPYKDPDFDVNRLAILVFSNRTYVSKAINKISGKNFHSWLADYRNDVAIKSLRSNPNQSVMDICVVTGHRGKEIFSRQFKQLNGITFTEFKSRVAELN